MRSGSMSLLSWLFTPKEPDNNTEVAKKLLGEVYLECAACLDKIIDYSPEKKTITCQVFTPALEYMRKKPPVETTVEHVLVLSELVYPFFYFLIRDKAITAITPSVFRKLMKQYRLPLAGLNIKSRRPISRNRKMLVTMEVKRLSKKGGNFVAVTDIWIKTLNGQVAVEGTLYPMALLK